MHVLYVIDSLVPGGAETSLLALAPYLINAGVQLDVAYLRDLPGLQAELEDAGAQLFCLAGHRQGRLRWARRVSALVAKRRPHLVHTTLFEADVAGRVAALVTRTPVVTSLVNVTYTAEHFADPRLRATRLRAASLIDALTAQRVIRFHAVAEFVADEMARQLRVSRERIDVVPRGRDPALLGTRNVDRRQAARESLGVGPATSVILAVGRQEQQKGFDTLIEAFAQILETFPHSLVLIAGRSGNDTAQLEHQAARLGLRDSVRLLGHRDDVPDLLSAADVFVLPSRREGSPGALLEAMALGAPIVAADLPSVREIVDDANAVLVRSSDADALARAVTSVLLGPEAAWQRAEEARARFLDRYTIERAAAGMLAFYEKALDDAKRRSFRWSGVQTRLPRQIRHPQR